MPAPILPRAPHSCPRQPQPLGCPTSSSTRNNRGFFCLFLKAWGGTPWTFAASDPLTSNGQVAVSAFGSGCACPTAVIAICPICQCSAEPQLEVCSAVHPSSLCPLAAFASWALQGYACIQVKGHSLPVVLL